MLDSVEIGQFQRCPIDPHCPYCGGNTEPGAIFDWSFVDAIYCISLVERPDRLASVIVEFHRVGLCGAVIFYRPKRHLRDPIIGIWESHSTVARYACERGHGRVLVLEDDVRFTRAMRPRRLQSIARAMTALPADWRIFYLGHWAIRATFVRRDVLRTRSACTHAYVANRSALAWLAAPQPRTSALRSIIAGRDSSVAASMPPLHPWGILTPAFPWSPSRIRAPAITSGRSGGGAFRNLRQVITRTRAREILLSKLIIPNQFFVVLRSSCSALWDRMSTHRRRYASAPPRI